MSEILHYLLQIIAGILLLRGIYSLGVPKRIRVTTSKAFKEIIEILCKGVDRLIDHLSKALKERELEKAKAKAEEDEEDLEMTEVSEVLEMTEVSEVVDTATDSSTSFKIIDLNDVKNLKTRELNIYEQSLEDTFNFIINSEEVSSKGKSNNL